MKAIKMDPNLEKMMEVHDKEIKKGKFFNVLAEAKDYLFKVTNPTKASREFSQFVKHLNKISKERH